VIVIEQVPPGAAGAAIAPALGALHALAFDDPALDPPWPAAEIAALIGTPGALALAASLEGDLAGFILIRTAADEAEVLTLAVAPARRRRGVGGRLLAAAGVAARSAGAEALFLEVAEDNAAALALYQAGGFWPVGRRPGYYARPGGAAAARILRRDLNR